MKTDTQETRGKPHFFKRNKKKTIMIVVIIALIAIGGSLIRQGQQAAAQADTVTTTQVARQNIEDNLTLKAVLEGTESVEVVSSLHAEVLTLHVQEGDRVVKGQLMATLDSTSLLQQISQEENALNLQQLQLNETLVDRQVEYEKALMAWESARTDYARLQALYEAGATTQQSLTAAADTLADTQRTVDSFTVSEGRVVAGDAENQALANAQQDLAVSRQDLEDTEIRSPIDGTVTRVYTKVGRFADDNMEDNLPLFVIENIDQLQMKVMVSEYDIAKVVLGQEVEITANILNGETVAGVVKRISPTGELKEGSTSERVVPVYVKVTEANERLIAGITAKATIKVDHAEDALVLPYEAIGEQGDGATVVYKVNDDHTVSVIPVRLGIENALTAEVIASEMEAGDLVITNPGPDLIEGMTVNPL